MSDQKDRYEPPKHLLSCGLVSIGQPGTTRCTCAAQRYPWRVTCSGCGWVDHFDTRDTAQEWADRHNSKTTSRPHDAKVGRRDGS